jgi:hypothetical protein
MIKDLLPHLGQPKPATEADGGAGVGRNFLVSIGYYE